MEKLAIDSIGFNKLKLKSIGGGTKYNNLECSTKLKLKLSTLKYFIGTSKLLTKS